MTRPWNWDFEDVLHPPRRRRSGAPAPGPTRPGAPAGPPAPGGPRAGRYRREDQIRRRRSGAGLIAAIVIAAILALLLSGSHHQTSTSASAAKARTQARHAHAIAASVPEHDQSSVGPVLAYTPFIKQGSGRVRDIALTFDDGPGPYTPAILGVLEHYHVHGTFFVIGRMLRYFSPSAVREIADGDVIGDHTETHPFLSGMSAHEQYEELFEQIARVELLGGQRPQLFRPPYGSFNATTWRELHRLHLLMVLWSVDTGDYSQPGVETIVQRALAGAHPGAIVLMHDAGGTRTETVEALPQIIRDLQARGYTLVTVPRLLREDPPPAGLPLPPNLSGD